MNSLKVDKRPNIAKDRNIIRCKSDGTYLKGREKQHESNK